MTIKLKDIKFFEGIELDYIKMIIDKSRREEYVSGDTIIRQGAESDGSAYIIQEGKVKVEIDDKNINTINEGNIFGEIALITNEPRVASIIAETDIVLLKINQELLHTIIKEFKNGKEIQKTLMNRVLENIKK